METHQQKTKRSRSSKPAFSDKNSSILWNKKGLFGEIMGSIGNFFQGILHIIPKQIIFLIFLFIILLLGQLLTYVFNIVGIYCTSGDIPVTIGFNPLKTAELIGEIPQASDLGKQILDPNALQQTTMDCSYTSNGLYTITYDNGTSENSSVKRHFYNGASGCVDCTLAKIDFHDLATPQQWCISDAHIKPDNEKSTLAKWFCGGRYFGRCEPPEGYYWQSSSGNYVCDDQSCASMTAGDYWDNILKENGAVPLYQDAYGQAQDTSHSALISIQCHDVHPRLTLYGIDIFNFDYWLLLMLAGIMLWALIRFL